ncbi:MAG: SDR family NAD(P)-dependent oxidoreductase [Bacteroidota bacterium]
MAFHGKVALITGGGSGIGRLHAQELAKTGATVAILDVNEQGLEETAKESANIHPYVCNVTDLSAVELVVETVSQDHGPVDRLIVCAAIMPGGALMESKADLLNNIMHINYGGMVNICQSVVPGMLARNHGDVIIYGSTAGILPVERFGGYGATKAASNFYAKVLIRENRGSAVRFQLVCPPAVDTPLINQVKENGPEFLKTIQQTRRNLATPQQVVRSVEKCLERGRALNYPGPARYVRWLHGIWPGLLRRFA